MDSQKTHRSLTEIYQQNEYAGSISPTKTYGSMGNNTDKVLKRNLIGS